VGERFHSAPVIRLADAKPVELGHQAQADGRWRLYAFADDAAASDPGSAMAAFLRFLENDPASPVLRYTQEGADPDHVFDVRAIYQQSHHSFSVADLPAFLLPRKGPFGLIDYEKVFAPDPKAVDIFDERGIDRTAGALVVVRPDQYVAHVLGLDAHAELTEFFEGILLPVR